MLGRALTLVKMKYLSSNPATLVIPEGMENLDTVRSKRVIGAARRQGALAWRMGPAMYAAPFMGPFALLLALL